MAIFLKTCISCVTFFMLLSSPIRGNKDTIALKNPKQTGNCLLLTAGYRVPVTKNVVINSGHGLYLEAGIKLSQLLHSKSFYGVYGGYGLMDRAWSTSFNKQFVADFNKSVIPDVVLSPLDSSVLNNFAKLLNNSGNALTPPGCSFNSFHNYSLYYGLFFKLPFKCQTVLKLYTGITRSHTQTGNVVSAKADYNIFQVRRKMYGVELMATDVLKCKKMQPGSLAISVYGELFNFNNASLYFNDGRQHTEMPFEKISSQNFVSKYHNSFSAGFKVAYNLNHK